MKKKGMKITTHPNIEGVNWIFAKLFWVQTFKYIYIYIYIYVIIKELKILMGSWTPLVKELV